MTWMPLSSLDAATGRPSHATAGLGRGTGAHDTLRYVTSTDPRRAGASRRPCPLAFHAQHDRAQRELEHKYEASASYFFIVPPAGGGSRYDCAYGTRGHCTFRGARTTVAEMIRALAADGFDVGLHGSYYSANRPGVLSHRTRDLRARDRDHPDHNDNTSCTWESHRRHNSRTPRVSLRTRRSASTARSAFGRPLRCPFASSTSPPTSSSHCSRFLWWSRTRRCSARSPCAAGSNTHASAFKSSWTRRERSAAQ